MSHRAILVLLGVLSFAVTVTAQQFGGTTKDGDPVSILLNTSQQAITVEVHLRANWKEFKIEAGEDGRMVGDRVRMATKRKDNAIITVDYPLEPAKKYRVFFNSQTGLWDFAPAG
jgi:hypothetical protein